MFLYHRSRDAAFTLVECLIVLCLISLLVTMLIPVLQKARQHADAVRCAAGLHQLGTYVSRYTFDNHDRFPPMFYNVADSADHDLTVTIAARTRRAAGIDDVPDGLLVCPSDLAPALATLLGGSNPPTVTGLPLSYSYNLATLRGGLLYGNLQLRTNFEKWPLFFDGTFGPQIQGNYASSMAFASATVVNRHPNGSNVLYADWHAQSTLTIDDLQIPAAPVVAQNDNSAGGGKGNGKSSGNNGHGNNEDGVDVSNPGKGKGGPNGDDDPSGDVDDEMP